MDPLSLTAGILAIIGAAKIVIQGLERLNSYRKAPQEIRDLLRDATELHVFLEGVGVVVEHYQSLRCTQNVRSLTEHIEKAGRKFHEIKCLLDSPFFRDSRLSDGNKARIAWLQNKNKVKKLQIELRATRVDLGTTLGLLTTSSTTELKEIMSASAAAHARNSEMLATVLERLTHIGQISPLGYLIDRYIAMVWKYAPLDGPAFSMRMPRVMPWTHLLWNYANNGDIVAIQRLFSEGKASPYDMNLRGGNALIYAATRRNVKLGQLLIQQGADADIADIFGRKPIEAFFDVFLSGQMDAEDSQIVKSMFESSDYAETRCFTMIHKIVLGIVSRDLETELRSSTATINTVDALNRTPICWATLRDDSTSVSTLLAFNADPNLIDYQSKNCLFYARSTEVCKRLLCANIDLHARTRKYARVPLHSVCSSIETAEILDVIDLLVNAGADVNIRDFDGETPLMNAVYKRYTSIARKLIDLGANVNIANHSSQETAVHFAVSFDHSEILPMLLDKGADYTARNIHGKSILHMAARTGGAKTVTALSKANLMGLDTSLKDDEGKTVHDYLAEREILSDSEVGLQENFQKFFALNTLKAPLSISPKSSANIDNVVYDLESEYEPNAFNHLPGAYPIFGEDH